MSRAKHESDQATNNYIKRSCSYLKDDWWQKPDHEEFEVELFLFQQIRLVKVLADPGNQDAYEDTDARLWKPVDMPLLEHEPDDEGARKRSDADNCGPLQHDDPLLLHDQREHSRLKGRTATAKPGKADGDESRVSPQLRSPPFSLSALPCSSSHHPSGPPVAMHSVHKSERRFATDRESGMQ
eukprot:scaffold6436_cov113-Isochrysis_galbana.AAC.8